MDLRLTFEMVDQTAQITLEGQLDTNTAYEFEAAVSAALERKAHDIVLYADKLQYVSSAGLRILLMARRQIPSDGSISIIGVSSAIHETLDMTGFSRILTIEERKQTAKLQPSSAAPNLAAIKPITVAGKVDSLNAIREYVQQSAERAGLSEEGAYWLALAVDEIATNIIVHGYQKAGRQGQLTLRSIINAEKLTLFLEDTAAPFDPRQKQPPANLKDSLEARDPGGLGIYLALAKLDGFEYESTPTRNHNIFVMRRSE
jgi:serine/threonine-protein kinase RsbW